MSDETPAANEGQTEKQEAVEPASQRVDFKRLFAPGVPDFRNLLALLNLATGLAMALGGLMCLERSARVSALGFGPIMVLTGMATLGAGVMLGISAFGILQGSSWTWIVTLIGACAGLAAALFGLMTYFAGGLFVAPYPGVLLYLCLKRDTRKELGG